MLAVQFGPLAGTIPETNRRLVIAASESNRQPGRKIMGVGEVQAPGAGASLHGDCLSRQEGACAQALGAAGSRVETGQLHGGGKVRFPVKVGGTEHEMIIPVKQGAQGTELHIQSTADLLALTEVVDRRIAPDAAAGQVAADVMQLIFGGVQPLRSEEH